MVIGWAGSSNTQSASGYRVLAQAGLLAENPRYEFSFLTIAQAGWGTFPNLVNKADLDTANLIIFDQSNDDENDLPECEALVRKASAAGQRVIAILNPSWSAVNNGQVNTPTNQTAIELMRTMLTAYGVPYVDGWAICQAYVTGGGNLSDYFADTAHWSATGHGVVAAALDDYLPTGGTIPTPLPAYVDADAADFENDPVIILGTNYDSRTGVWTDNGTSTSSSEVGATITYSGTFRKFGCYRADATYPNVEISIDGGAFAAVVFYANGYDIGTRAAHTIVIKVLTTCKIDEFIAI